MRRTSIVVATLVCAATALVAPTAGVHAAAGSNATDRDILFQDWTKGEFAAGFFYGTDANRHGTLVMKHAVGTRPYTDPFGDGTTRRYEYARWTSRTVDPGFDLTELVASWNASTPRESWLEVQMRGQTPSGEPSKWYVMGRWAEDDPADGGAIHRTSLSGQGDDIGFVAIDTFVAEEGQYLSDWKVRLTLHRPVGATYSPKVSMVGAMASSLPSDETVPVSRPGRARGITLDVPTLSQETHIGHYPQWDNGGEAWCSPTSTAMVLDYWGVGPSAEDTAWVEPDNDPQVDYAARNVFDYNYDGAGNWPYNTAYAGRYGMESFVTRLRSLREAERFIARGIPLVFSVSFEEEEMDGAGYGTNGHLWVVTGFTRDGDVVVNDPASHLIPSNDEVRVVYDRQQVENAWLPHSGGIVYVIHPPWVRLPSSPTQPNW